MLAPDFLFFKEGKAEDPPPHHRSIARKLPIALERSGVQGPCKVIPIPWKGDQLEKGLWPGPFLGAMGPQPRGGAPKDGREVVTLFLGRGAETRRDWLRLFPPNPRAPLCPQCVYCRWKE